MSFTEYKSKFTLKATLAGYSNDLIELCLIYAEPILSKGFPIIYSTNHLSALVGYNKKYIKRAVLREKYFYREFKIKKRNGKLRSLAEPLPSLKHIQRWILHNILENYGVSQYAKAYVHDKNIKDHVKYHRRQNIVITIDIKNFFGSIKLESIQSIYKSIGYTDLLSNLLGKLCTYNGVLPQGSPTSPYLSNIYLNKFDETIAKYCELRKIRYTRYADDMAFSGMRINTETLNGFVSSELKNLGLTINEDKTRIFKQYHKQVICGLVVNKKMQVDKIVRNELRQAVYYIQKYGLANHLQHIECVKANYIKHLLGKVNYVLHINPNDKQAKNQKSILLRYLD